MRLHSEQPEAEDLASVLAGSPYRARRFLGQGGMGQVWEVEHEFLRRPFAIKVLHAHLGHLADRMRVEAQAMGRVNHPHVVEVVDFWIASGGRACVVTDLLEGRTLWEELCDRRVLPAVEACELACEALSALAAAHALGVIHRDIKPENLFLHDARGYRRMLKVLDFGVARVLPNASERAPAPLSNPTATGMLVGSPRFMSPEACRGERVDHRADLYSLGVVLYVMLTGHGPYDMGTSHFAPPSRHVADIPAELDDTVLRAIHEAPAERFQTASEFTRALRPFLSPGLPQRRG